MTRGSQKKDEPVEPLEPITPDSGWQPASASEEPPEAGNADEPEPAPESEHDEAGAGEPTPSARARADAPWSPPRELALLAAGLVALACAVGVFAFSKKWTPPTLGVVLATGLVEATVAVVLSVQLALSENRRKGIFVPGIVVAALGALSLAGVLFLGIV